MRLCLIGIVSCAGSSCVCDAQSNGRYEFVFVGGVVSPATPSARFGLYAAWDEQRPGDFVWGAGDYDLVASSGVFTVAKLVMGNMPPNNPGVINGNRVDGAAIGQVHIPSIGIFGDPSNPVLLAEYVWTTSDFTPRMVEFVTENTTNFSLVGRSSVSPNLVRSGQFTPGFGSIRIVPDPGTLVLLGLAALSRRRR